MKSLRRRSTKTTPFVVIEQTETISKAYRRPARTFRNSHKGVITRSRPTRPGVENHRLLRDKGSELAIAPSICA